MYNSLAHYFVGPMVTVLLALCNLLFATGYQEVAGHTSVNAAPIHNFAKRHFLEGKYEFQRGDVHKKYIAWILKISPIILQCFLSQQLL